MKDFRYKLQQKVLNSPLLFWLVTLVCLGGTLYGFYWYKYQLAQTPHIFWIFTPDCPEAVFFFLIWVGLWKARLWNETFKVIAVTALLKFGIWTVSVIGLFWIDRHIFYWDNIMLFTSHVGMLILGLTFAARLKITGRGFLVTAGWMILSDFVDYYFKVYPWLPDPERLGVIRMGTFILTGLIIVWMFKQYLNYRNTLSLPKAEMVGVGSGKSAQKK